MLYQYNELQIITQQELKKLTIYNFINNMIEESKYYSKVMKKHLNKELVMTKEDNEDFKNSNKCWICENDYVDNDIKVRDHCHTTGKGSAQRDCNINLKVNHEITVVFLTLKNYDSHLIMQELGKFKISK